VRIGFPITRDHGDGGDHGDLLSCSLMRPRLSLYIAAIFLSSSLLFLVEPMAGKRLLPLLGGSSAVWITCLVFFQTTLLQGYLCAHPGARSSWRMDFYWH
jgi:hypothetical protein